MGITPALRTVLVRSTSDTDTTSSLFPANMFSSLALNNKNKQVSQEFQGLACSKPYCGGCATDLRLDVSVSGPVLLERGRRNDSRENTHSLKLPQCPSAQAE